MRTVFAFFVSPHIKEEVNATYETSAPCRGYLRSSG